MKAFIKGGLIAEISKSQKRIKFNGDWYSINTGLNGHSWFMYSDRKTTRSIQFALFDTEVLLTSPIETEQEFIDYLNDFMPEYAKKDSILIKTYGATKVFRYTDKWECLTNWNKIENLEYIAR